MKTIFDQEERDAAIDPTRSFIVQAPAGSGKTELLIQRYLNLLAKVEYPEQILCMTFTRKAAGEMRARIFEALISSSQESCPPEPHQQKTRTLAKRALEQNEKQGWDLLNFPARLKVQTIDSFCAWLVGRTPLISRLGAQINPDQFSAVAYLETAQRLLALVEKESPTAEHVRNVLRHLDNNKSDFLKRIRFLLEKRDQWLIPFFGSLKISPEDRNWLESNHKNLIDSVLQNVDSIFPKSLKEKLFPLWRYSLDHLEESSSDPEFSQEFPKPDHDNLLQWKSIATLLLTDKGQCRKRIDKNIGFPPDAQGVTERKQAFKSFLEELEEFPGLIEAIGDIRNLPPVKYSESDWNILRSTLHLLEPLDRTLRQVFREKGITDFTEISLAALKSLGDFDQDGNLLPTDLTEYLDYKIQHLLVDEFQDTSYKQLELLSRLTAGWQSSEGRTLFIVGDPMQSIYRFRDAEVGLFMVTQRQGVGDIALESLVLKTNFRSQESVVDWVNECFRTIFPSSAGQGLGEVPYAESQAFNPAIPLPGVVHHPQVEKDEFEEAKQIVNLVQELMEAHPEKSIAILVRAKNHLNLIVRELRHRQLTYKAEDVYPLIDRWEILDLLSLTRALYSKLDRVSWLSVLRTPWVGISLKDLHRLCQNSSKQAVWFLLNDNKIVSQLSIDGQARIKRFVQTLEPALKSSAHIGMRQLVEGLWIKLGGAASVPSASIQDAEHFFDELERFQMAEGSGNLDQFENNLMRLFASPGASEGNLHLMTMHKAKGLEFDFVILPGLGKKISAEKNRLFFWMPHGNSLLLAPIQETGTPASPIYEYIKTLNQKKDQFESVRLLYVSATRARMQLHLFGHLQSKKEGLAPEPSSLLAILWPHLAEQWSAQLSESAVEDSSVEDPSFPGSIQRLPADFELGPSTKALPTGKNIALKESEEPLFEWAGLRARCLGIVLHQCLQFLAMKSDLETEFQKMKISPVKIIAAFKSLGLCRNDLKWAVEQTTQALSRTLEDPQGQWVLAPHAEAANELPITVSEKGKIEKRILDRTFVDGKTRWIIDYKTGIHEGANIDQFLNNEIDRHRPQLEKYEDALRRMGESRPIKKALYHPFYQKLFYL